MQHLSRKAVASINVSITGREIYDLLMEVRGDAQELSGNVEAMHTGFTDHETHMRDLEKAVWGYAGAAAVGGAGCSGRWSGRGWGRGLAERRVRVPK